VAAVSTDPRGLGRVAEAYLAAWNRHDPGAVAGAFAPGGTYTGPDGVVLTGEAVAAAAASRFAVFPDLAFAPGRVVGAGAGRDGTVTAEWRLRGTHRGPLAGFPPTGRTVDVPGTTVLDVAGGSVHAAREYTDRQALLEQLGLQVVVQPPALGPLTFGTGLRVHHGQTSRPGALSLNVLDFGPEGEPGGTLQALGLPVVEELASTAGFLGLTIAGFGARGCLLAAWEGPEHPRQLLRSPAHAEAVRRFSQPDFVASEMSSVWTPVYLRWRVRCPACGRKSDPERAAGLCPCGQRLPPPPPSL
jgi:predicted ester cyclase